MNFDGSNLQLLLVHPDRIESGAKRIPVIEDLTAHDVTANPPTILVASVPQPVVTQDLCVEVMGLE